jgi:hypothetical protein
MARFRVTAPELNVRSSPAVLPDNVVTVMPRDTLYERGDEAAGGRFARITVEMGGDPITGFASTRADLSAPADPATGLSGKRFNLEARTRYVRSILDDRDAKNFLRKSAQAWGSDRWIHGFQEDGRFFRVSADWSDAQNGKLTITSGTEEIGAQKFKQVFPERADTFCNFNVSFCYVQAYGGPNLQDTNGSAAGGERNANTMVDVLRQKWRAVTPGTAARIANAGGFVFVGKKASGHGHVMFLLEGSDESGDFEGDSRDACACLRRPCPRRSAPRQRRRPAGRSPCRGRARGAPFRTTARAGRRC